MQLDYDFFKINKRLTPKRGENHYIRTFFTRELLQPFNYIIG